MSSNRLYFEPEPLIDYLENYLGLETNIEMASHLGVSHKTVQEWRSGRRKIRFKTGDEIGVKLVGHPSILWPEYWDMPMEDKRDRDRRRKQEIRDKAKAKAEMERQK